MSKMPSNATLTVEEDVFIRFFLQEGMAVDAVADMVGLPVAVVALRRVQLGFHRVIVIWTDTMDATLQEMRAAGRSLRAIGKTIGVSRQAVYKRLVTLGMRDRERKPVQPDPMIAIVAEISHRAVPQYLDDNATCEAISVAGRALRMLLADPRLEIRLRDPS